MIKKENSFAIKKLVYTFAAGFKMNHVREETVLH